MRQDQFFELLNLVLKTVCHEMATPLSLLETVDELEGRDLSRVSEEIDEIRAGKDRLFATRHELKQISSALNREHNGAYPESLSEILRLAFGEERAELGKFSQLSISAGIDVGFLLKALRLSSVLYGDYAIDQPDGVDSQVVWIRFGDTQGNQLDEYLDCYAELIENTSPRLGDVTRLLIGAAAKRSGAGFRRFENGVSIGIKVVSG